MATFVEEFGLGNFEHIVDPNGEVWSLFGITAQPSYVFLNDDGAMSRQIGSLEPEAFAEVLHQLATT